MRNTSDNGLLIVIIANILIVIIAITLIVIIAILLTVIIAILLIVTIAILLIEGTCKERDVERVWTEVTLDRRIKREEE